MNNNKDRYQRTFNSLHLSDDFRDKIMESPDDNGRGKIMNFRSIHGISRVAAAVATVFTIALGSAGVCYACDLGGIRTNLGLWMNGELRNVDVYDAGDGSYVIYDETGNTQQAMGGLIIDEDGSQTQMSAEELAGYMNNECHLDNVDGRMIFSYKNLSEDVTDLIDEKGNLYIHVEDPSNEYTYFHLYDITDHGYSTDAGRNPSFGKKYYEMDSADLVITEGNSRMDDYSYSTTVITGED
ncbi:MAG: hypothetical protein K5871_08315 [Lachnospiraceae bacterium]|nr:hypothetical protein [Lachnospiraceae bacterium]